MMAQKERIDLDQIKVLIAVAIDEDLGSGDVTTEAIVESKTMASGRFVTREDGVIAGLPVVEHVFREVANRLVSKGRRITAKTVGFEAMVNDGDLARSGDTIAAINGPALVLLSGERLALNFLQRLSGIATMTRKYVDAVKGYATQVMDTRKTTPGWRYLEKYAVRMGGGANHRIGLYDMVLIKDNHLEIAEKRWPHENPIKHAVMACKEKTCGKMKIEVEVENIAQVRAAVEAGVDIIMFDNMSLDEMTEADNLVKASARNILTEASGGITLDRLVEIAQTGVDRISIGVLTHSAKALDISLEM